MPMPEIIINDDISCAVSTAYDLLLAVIPTSNKMDYPAFGSFFCMLLEEWCLYHHADVTDVIQEIQKLVHTATVCCRKAKIRKESRHV